MTARRDRVGELIEGIRRQHRTIISPEGVELDIQIASRGERLSAFLLDIVFLFGIIIALFLFATLMFFSNTNTSVGMTLILFLAFVVRTLYFIHFELAWQGRSPGKRICGLRVISRDGGALTPSAIVARNLTREVEFFLPFSLYMGLGSNATLQEFALLGWVLIISCLPMFNRDRLRAGDIIAGTLVIAMPKRLLLGDLTTTISPVESTSQPAFIFTHDQLAQYGAFELQVLEEVLRRPISLESNKLLVEIRHKICTKIGWPDTVPDSDTRRFLTDFYAAERADLERGQLFGNLRADKTEASRREPQL